MIQWEVSTQSRLFLYARNFIGKFCQIGKGVEFVMNGANHQMNAASTFPFYIFRGWEMDAPKREDLPLKGDTVVGNDVRIGEGATILPGIHIGDGAIIGKNAVVGFAHCRDPKPHPHPDRFGFGTGEGQDSGDS